MDKGPSRSKMSDTINIYYNLLRVENHEFKLDATTILQK